MALFIAPALSLGATPSSDKTPSDKASKRVIPVLVTINTHGKVTEVDPAFRLSPKYKDLLSKTLSAMIKTPAREHGKPVTSQLLMSMQLKAEANPDGNYAVHFAYVNSKQMPTGSWYWVHTSQHQLRLANRYATGSPTVSFGGPLQLPSSTSLPITSSR